MEGFQNFNNSQNFDPNSLANMTSMAIMFIAINDVSPSISSYETTMNTVARDVFIQDLKNSHRKDDIVVKAITFCEKVEHKSGFMPILNVQDDYFDVHNTGRGTALYDAVLQGLEHAIAYRKDLEEQGIDVRTAIFISTDGEDNSSSSGAAAKIKKIVEDLRRNEAWASSFTINMLGVGQPHYFQDACTEMGLDHTKCLVTVGNSASEIRKQMGVVSQSVSSSSGSTAGVNF
jgi:uncharacterized protein YegL